MAFPLLIKGHRGINMKKNQNKYIAIFALSLMAVIGTYNALMINSESFLSGSDTKKFKRLDEVYGIVKTGRSLAVDSQWIKIPTISKETKAAPKTIIASTNSSTTNTVTEAAINESLNLKLIEVMNPKKWQNGIKESEFNGSIATNNGVIESLNASLPEEMKIEISFSEMTGNTFEYDLNGQIYSGLMYQVDQNSYMITLTNGPLEGTRLRFAGESTDAQSQQEQAQAYLAENHQVELGTFGEEMQDQPASLDTEASVQLVESPTFNFNQI